jgi:hypothetical protein
MGEIMRTHLIIWKAPLKHAHPHCHTYYEPEAKIKYREMLENGVNVIFYGLISDINKLTDDSGSLK